MLVMVTEAVPERLRGQLSLCMVELQTGVFVGRVTPVVRDQLWALALKLAGVGRVVQAWSESSEQGFRMRMHGDGRRSVVDLDGIQLVAVKTAASKSVARRRLIAG